MNQPKHVVLIAGLFGLLALPGCYTQLGMTRQEREPAEREYTATEPDTSTSYAEDQQYDNGYDQYADQWRPHVGFSYYYPSTYWPSAAFAFSYGNPWAFDSYYAYDPWICGTPYVHYPYYGYGYYPSYFYPSYPYHYGYAYTGGRNVGHGSREFGMTRGSTSGGRGAQGSGGYVPNSSVGSGSELPRGSRLSSPQGAPAAPRSANPAVAPTGRTSGTSRSAYVPRSGGRSTNPPSAPGVRSSSRGGNSRGEARKAQPRSRTPQAPSAPPARSRDGGTQGSPPPAPSYTPPPQHSAPAPASAPSGGSGGRGGNTRGRRP